MRQIKYGDSSYALRFEFPDTWRTDPPTAVTVGFTTKANAELLEATSTAMRAATALGADGVYGDSTILITAGAGAFGEPGDRMLIADSDDGPPEIVESTHYDSSTRTFTLRDELSEEHESATVVTGFYTVYDADLSGDDFTKGLEFVITWTPNNDSPPITEIAIIAGASYSMSDFWSSFQTAYPTEYTVIENRDRDAFEKLTHAHVRTAFLTRCKAFDRVVDQPFMDIGYMLMARKLVLSSQGDEQEHEQGVADKAWTDWFTAILENVSIWFDKDQDGVEDAGEAQPAIFECTHRHM